jgi:predicted nucleic acid-binding protein
LTIETPKSLGTIAALKLVVDAGEAEAITLAYERGCRIVLDDRKARVAAAQLGVPITGTVGLLLKAKQAGHIPAILPLLDALDANQFRVSLALRAEALRLAGE